MKCIPLFLLGVFVWTLSSCDDGGESPPEEEASQINGVIVMTAFSTESRMPTGMALW